MIYDESDLGVKYAFYTCKFMHKAVYGLISIRDFHFEVWVKLNYNASTSQGRAGDFVFHCSISRRAMPNISYWKSFFKNRVVQISLCAVIGDALLISIGCESYY